MISIVFILFICKLNLSIYFVAKVLFSKILQVQFLTWEENFKNTCEDKVMEPLKRFQDFISSEQD